MEQEFIGNYRVLKKIGAGGMAKVYLAVHKDVPNLKVILKILDNPELGERFKQEADKLALLDGHPNICRIKHFFNHGDNTVIAMEFIDGMTLEDRMKSDDRPTMEEAIQITCDVLDILDFAHEKGIYHRDIKPGNIMIDKKGHVKIIDFGIAKGKTDPNLTMAGTACGTPAYMSPEQFNPSEETNYALVDVYAVGTTLFNMLTGDCPFKGDNAFALRDAKLFSDPPHASDLARDVPKQLDQIVTKSLARDAENRYQSAAEMQRALEALQPSGGTQVRPTSPAMAVGAPTPPPKGAGKSRRSLLIGLAAVVVIAIAAVVGYGLYGRGGDGGGGDATPVDTTSVAGDGALSTARGTIALAVTPRGDIFVDDSLLARMGTSALFVGDTGSHTIRVENSEARRTRHTEVVFLAKDQFLQWNHEFEINEPDPTPVVIDNKPPVSVKGRVDVGSNPRGAEIVIDGVRMNKITNYRFQLDPGEHVISVQLNSDSGSVSRSDTVLVESGGKHKVTFDLTK